MCTVTFIPAGDTVYIASNRDEQLLRKPATHPIIGSFSSGRIMYPKDGEKGGTWIGAHENGNAMVLLNGAFDRHTRVLPYDRSRGLVFLEIFNSDFPRLAFEDVSLYNIEPFTLVLWYAHGKEVWEMRWDGQQRYIAQKNALVPQIWSSATLYDKEVIYKREHWFDNWLQTKPSINISNIINFHEFGGEGDAYIDLRMNRNGILQTVSITAMQCGTGDLSMHYHDLVDDTRSVNRW